MNIPEPRPGLVIRYGFLWSHERTTGSTEASKDRPCAIVVATSAGPDGATRATLAAITHSPPDDPAGSLEIPPAICRTLGLDSGRHWLRLDELNRFIWPGYDLRPIPGRGDDCVYGMLPPALYERMRQGILLRQKEARLRIQTRDD